MVTPLGAELVMLTRGELRAATAKAKKKESAIDLAFVANCAKLLGSLELEKLDPTQSQSLSIDLDSLRLEIDAKPRQLVAGWSLPDDRWRTAKEATPSGSSWRSSDAGFL